MKKKKIKRVSALALSLVMALSLTSLPVYAAEMESGTASLTVNSSKVAFAGYEWWVIGNETSGVYPQANHITLLSANTNFGTTAFRSDSNTSYSSTRNEYAKSDLQQYMENIPSSYNFPAKEQNVITARDLAKGETSESNGWSFSKDYEDYKDGIAGQGIEDQKLWALSEEEWTKIDDSGEGEEVLSYGSSYYYWLRSPTLYNESAAQMGHHDGSTTDSGDVILDEIFARPAFSLDLSSVLFTSAASERGKSAVEVNDSLISMDEIDNSSTVKFTMKDDSQTLTVDVTEQVSETLEFSYSGATIGENQYVSCVLTDSDDNVKYYAKLVGCSDSNAADGNLYISLANVTEGTYTLKIFSEQANGNSYTDFCSEPVTAMLAVDENAVGTVSNFGDDDTSTGTTGSDSTGTTGSASTTGTTSTGSTTGTADTDSTPQTGDNSTFALWIAIMLMTGAGLTSSLVFLRKHR